MEERLKVLPSTPVLDRQRSVQQRLRGAFRAGPRVS